MKKRYGKRILSLALCAVILIGTSLTCGSGVRAASLEQQKEQLESQLSSQKKEQQRIANLIAEAKKNINNQLEIIQLIYDEMHSIQEQQNTLVSLIVEYTELAKAKEAEIDFLNRKIDENFELFKERLIFAQESGSIGYIDFILGSSDLSDIISRAEVIDDMLQYDRKIIESLLEDKKKIEIAKLEIDSVLNSCEEKQAEYDSVVETLNLRKQEADAVLNELSGNQKELEQAQQIIANATKETEKDLDEINKQIAENSKPKPGPTGFTWPLPVANPGYITQYFHSGHSGLDIGVGGWANNGKVPAIAIAAGEVVRVGSYWDWGNLVVVDHGGGYLSYYAHLHSINVSIGQKVSQGQQVGKIGSTGQSTGPHLHLVIYAPVGANGASIRTDPLKYVVFPR